MEINDLGDVIAVRELSLAEGDVGHGTVLVKLGRPQKFPDSTDYYVPFQITGVGSEKIKYAGGVDAIQAIQLAIKAIDVYLDKLNRDLGGGLKWDAGDIRDLGFGSHGKGM